VTGSLSDRFHEATDRAATGGPERHHEKLKTQGKMFVRDRVDLLCDPGSFIEDGLLANALEEGFGADAVVTGRGTVDGRPVIVIANDPTVKAGSWGRLTVEKLIRALEAAYDEMLPVFYLVDSGGARITDQVDLFPGRRGAGKIFYNQVRLSGRVPQICCLFGPSAAGGAYIPSFCDVVVMVEGRASMYLGSPRMAQMVIGEETTLEEMGGARMHCEVSGCGDALVQSDAEAISWAQQYFSYVADHYRVLPPAYAAEPTAEGYLPAETLPEDPKAVYDMLDFLRSVVDEGSIFQVKELYAREVITAFALLDGKPVGIVASQPNHLGGVLFVDSADKAARFMWLCDAMNLPLLYFADVPGFMVGEKAERAGVLRAGMRAVYVASQARVPVMTLVIRKCYGMAGIATCHQAGLNLRIAWPSAEWGSLPVEGGVAAAFRREIANAPDPAKRTQELEDEMREYSSPFLTAEAFGVEDIIDPRDTRRLLCQWAGLVAGARQTGAQHFTYRP